MPRKQNSRRKRKKKGGGKKRKKIEVNSIDLSGNDSSATTIASTSSGQEDHRPNPTVCILSIDNPREYSLRLDSIEPSFDFEFEPPVAAEATANHHHHQQAGFIDLIDYLYKFPFLVIRNGQLAIDPQMNIENRSQTHFLRSKHLRFETLSSLNVTLRFRRSVPYGEDHSGPQQKTVEEATAEPSLVDTIQKIASYIALKMVNIGDAPLDSRRDDGWLNTLTTFHLISIVLSQFIFLTLLIYAVIAVHGRKVRRKLQLQLQQQQQQQTEAQHEAQANGSNQSISVEVEQQSLEMDYYDYVQPLQTEKRTDSAKHFQTLPIRITAETAKGDPNGSIRSLVTLAKESRVEGVSTLAFTKPPVLLSTFIRAE